MKKYGLFITIEELLLIIVHGERMHQLLMKSDFVAVSERGSVRYL